MRSGSRKLTWPVLAITLLVAAMALAACGGDTEALRIPGPTPTAEIPQG